MLRSSANTLVPNPDKFRPEKWLRADKEKLNSIKIRNLSFGGPYREYPGMQLVWVGMSKMSALFLLTFDVELLHELDSKPGPGDRSWREYGKFVTTWQGMEVR